MNKVFILITIIYLSFVSCQKDPKTNEVTTPVTNPLVTTNDVILNFTNVADTAVLQISKDTIYTASTPKYINANGDTFSVTKFKYYVSNIKLKRLDGTYYTEPESYHLLNAGDTINYCRFSLKKVPYDYYVSIEFILGVDSFRNCDGAQSGALDPSEDMFWSWSSGYIFVKFEGYSSRSYPSNSHNLTFHVGGYLTPDNNIRTITLPFNAPYLNVRKENVATVYFKTNVLEIFRSTSTIDFFALNGITNPKSAKTIVANYVDMFSISAIKN